VPESTPTVFLDRDGTLNHEKHYLSDPDDLELLPDAEQLATLRQAGFQLIVITNQSPIGRGIFTEERLAEIHKRLDEMLISVGVQIDVRRAKTPVCNPSCWKPDTEKQSTIVRNARRGSITICLDWQPPWKPSRTSPALLETHKRNE
jgi:histidinol-phosphate phosphatase family protein